jgi:hypothetical protein
VASRLAGAGDQEPPAPGRCWLGVAASVALYLQIVLGALTTHAGWIALHLAGAVLAVALPATAALRVLARHAGRPSLAWPARALGVLLAVQVTLGLGAYVAAYRGHAAALPPSCPPGRPPSTASFPAPRRFPPTPGAHAAHTGGESVAAPLLRRRVPA